LLLALCLAGPPATALDPAKPLEQYRYEVWEEAEGLPHYSINAIAQTQDGYLWLGSYYGLVRFDGIEFKVFDTANTPLLPSNKIWALAVDPEGKLWIGTSRGLAVLENGEIVRVPETEAKSVRTLLVSTRGEVWAGLAEGGLFVKRGKRFEPAGLEGETVRSLAEDRHGNLWAGTHTGVYGATAGGFVRYTKHEGLPDNRILSLHEDDEGVLWIGTVSGLACRRDGRIETYNHIPALKGRIVRVLEKDRDGSLWIGLFGGGLVRRALGRFEVHRNPRPLVSEAITAIHEDREGGIWIGASGGGLARLRDVPFYTLTTRNGLAGNLVQTVAPARDGTMWVGFNGEGVNRLSPEGRPLVTLSRENGLSSDDIWSLHECRHGDLWVGAYSGEVNWVRNGQIRTLGRADGLPGHPVLSLLEDRTGALWIGTSNGGLVVRRNGRTRTYRTEDGLASNNVRILHEDRQGRLWIGTDKGLNILEDGNFFTYTRRDGLAGDFVHSIYEEAGGAVWIGSFDGGLTRFRDGKFSAFTPESGFPARVVFQILEDGNLDLWISSSTGIFRVNKTDLDDFAAGKTRRIRFSEYGILDGLNSRECNGGQPGGARSQDGRLWFPTMKGLSIVDPKRAVSNSLPPPLVIEEFRADSIEYPVKGSIQLPAGARNLEIRYAALSLAAPAKNTFRYRLEPYDKDWVEGGNRRTAYYTNLPPGSYRFHVIAANNDGVWNEEGVALAFTLRPHFYQTPAFMLACLIAGLGLVWAGHNLRLRTLVGLNKELEVRVAERTAKLEEANREMSQLIEQIEIARAKAEQASRVRSEFVANVSHELRTPMNGVLGMLGLALDTPLRPDQQEYLHLAQESAESLLTLLNDILDFSKIDAGHVSVEAVPFDPRATVEAVVQIMRLRAQAKGLWLADEISPAFPECVVGDAGRLRQILLNLVGNSIKFTDTGGVTVRAAASVDSAGGIEMRFSVADTGIGIAEQDLATIFEPFRQADNSTTRRFGGTGLGLTISAKLVAAMCGRIWVESKVGAGSTFHFTVPTKLASCAAAARDGEPAATGIFPLTVLLAEDDRINQKVALTLLEKMGCKVDVVDNGREAVARLNKQHYDVVLMDVHMPELDGLAATAAIREREKRTGGHVPIIALTALAMAGDAERCLQAGMDGYVSKPVSRASLTETLASVAARKPKPEDEEGSQQREAGHRPRVGVQ
jgi:signal transduction histidine kinase/ligand-binding sensor domain-containing protein/ActR/RegA family two-component response regulator